MVDFEPRKIKIVILNMYGGQKNIKTAQIIGVVYDRRKKEAVEKACLYSSNTAGPSAYDFKKGGEQPYPAGPGNATICSVSTDPICKKEAVEKVMAGNFTVRGGVFCEDFTESLNPPPTEDGLPLKFCRIYAINYECQLFTSPKDNKTALVRCKADEPDLIDP
ncbi:hypothetical protein WDU94_010722 [Cyamophila willieti]